MTDFACALNDFMDLGIYAKWGLEKVEGSLCVSVRGTSERAKTDGFLNQVRQILGDADVACVFVGCESDCELAINAKLTGTDVEMPVIQHASIHTSIHSYMHTHAPNKRAHT